MTHRRSQPQFEGGSASSDAATSSAGRSMPSSSRRTSDAGDSSDGLQWWDERMAAEEQKLAETGLQQSPHPALPSLAPPPPESPLPVVSPYVSFAQRRENRRLAERREAIRVMSLTPAQRLNERVVASYRRSSEHGIIPEVPRIFRSRHLTQQAVAYQRRLPDTDPVEDFLPLGPPLLSSSSSDSVSIAPSQDM
jgi:hypothetical protein